MTGSDAKTQGAAFAGDPRAVGEEQGRLVRPWRDAVVAKLKPVRDITFPIGGLSRSDCEAAYIRLVEKWAPHWMAESEGMAAGLEMPAEDLLFLNAMRGLVNWGSCQENCTSWVVLPEAAAGGRMMLHKTRDGGSAWQGCLSKHLTGIRRWVGMVDLLGIGVLAGVNDAGVAATVNNGELCNENNRCGLGTPPIIRILLERCATAAEAVDLCVELILAGDYAHGNAGSIFLVADARRAFVIENTARRAISVEVPNGFEVRSNDWLLPGMKAVATGLPEKKRISALTRRERAVSFLRERRASGGIAVSDLRALCRDRVNAGDPANGSPIANDRTSFGLTMILDPDRPESDTELSVLMGPTPGCCALPFAFGVSAIPAFVADSRMTQRAYEVAKKRGMEGDHVAFFTEKEKELDRILARGREDARRERDQGNGDAAVKALTTSLDEVAHGAYAAMASMLDHQENGEDHA